MKYSGKMRLMVILKVKKTRASEDRFFGKIIGGGEVSKRPYSSFSFLKDKEIKINKVKRN